MFELLIEYWGQVLQRPFSLRDLPRQLWYLLSGPPIYLATIWLPWLFLLPTVLPWSWLPDALLWRVMPTVYSNKHSEENIQGFHGADGRFVPGAFDAHFDAATGNHPLALTDTELSYFTAAHRHPKNRLSSLLAILERETVSRLLRREDGMVSHNDLQNFYCGLSFPYLVHSRVSAAPLVQEGPGGHPSPVRGSSTAAQPSTAPSLSTAPGPSMSSSLIATAGPGPAPGLTVTAGPSTAPGLSIAAGPSTAPSLSTAPGPSTASSLSTASGPSTASSLSTASGLITTAGPGPAPGLTVTAGPSTAPGLSIEASPRTAARALRLSQRRIRNQRRTQSQ